MLSHYGAISETVCAGRLSTAVSLALHSPYLSPSLSLSLSPSLSRSLLVPYTGRAVLILLTPPPCCQDGDGEELYLDQLFDALVPLDTLPVDKSRNTDANDKYGYVWYSDFDIVSTHR